MAGGDSYYKVPDIQWIILIPFGMLLASLPYVAPAYFPYTYLGPIGSLVSYLVTSHPPVVAALFYFAWGTHLLEAFYTIHLCRSHHVTPAATLQWFVSVSLFGMFSMKDLRAHLRRKGK